MALHDVFVYGTLQFPEVLRALIARVPESQPATLAGYKRYRVQNQVFPAIIPGDAEDRVSGLLLSGLNAHDMKMFDAFEGEEYVKTAGSIKLQESGSPHAALYYVWQPSLRDCLDLRPWDPQEFVDKHLAEYERMCIKFGAEPYQWK